MKKHNKTSQNIAPIAFSGEAITACKIDNLLTESYCLTIVDGVVVDVARVSRAPDLPATAIGLAAKKMWELIRKPNPTIQISEDQERDAE